MLEAMVGPDRYLVYECGGNKGWRCEKCRYLKGEADPKYWPSDNPDNVVCTSCLVEMVLVEFDRLAGILAGKA